MAAFASAARTNLATVRRNVTGEEIHESRFTGTVPAEQADPFSGLDLKGTRSRSGVPPKLMETSLTQISPIKAPQRPASYRFLKKNVLSMAPMSLPVSSQPSGESLFLLCSWRLRPGRAVACNRRQHSLRIPLSLSFSDCLD